MTCKLQEAELMLTQYAAVARSRDERVRSAVAAGVSKHRVHVLTGIGRMTIERILGGPDDGPMTDQGRESGS
jgi:hypothetical protein